MVTNTYHTISNSVKDLVNISVHGKLNGKIRVLTIDKEDEGLARNHVWNVNTGGYGVCTCHQILMHRLIALAKKGDVVDHKNHNQNDNTRRNLRVGSHSDNMKNRLAHKSNTYAPPIAGVQWTGSSWMAVIMKNGVTFAERGFDTMHEAICCRIRMEYELNGNKSPNYRPVLKKMPRALLLQYFPEIYSHRNIEFIGSKIFDAHYKNSYHKSWSKHCLGVRKVGLTKVAPDM